LRDARQRRQARRAAYRPVGGGARHPGPAARRSPAVLAEAGQGRRPEPEQHPRRAGRPLRRDPRELRHGGRHFRLVPDPDRRQDRDCGEVRDPARLPRPSGPGLVVRIRAVRQSDSHRVRHDRERRSRRRRRGARRAPGLREVLRSRPELVQRLRREQRLMATIARETRAARGHVGSEVGAYLRHLDYLLIAAVGGVIAYGLWVLTAVTRNDVPGDASYFVSRQQVYIAVGAVLAAVVAAISPDIYRRYANGLYALAVALLLLVLVVGDDVRGSKRWIEFGSFRFQPSEIGKVLLILFLAAFVANRVRSDTPWKTVWGAVGLASLPMILVFKEPDFGSTLIYGSALLAVLVFGGVPW